MKCPKCHADNPEMKQFCGDCGTQLPTPLGHPPVVTETLQTPVHELATGTTFADRYQVIEELGHGGMGRVYKVLDTKIGEKVALKLIRPEAGLDKKSLERFTNEIKLARKIRHKNVCQMFDLGEKQGTRYITMEYVHGEDLKQLIRKVGQLSQGQAIGIARQVCDGLEEAHKLGVVHRDLKPQNIMVDEDGNARIMDFGIARSLSGKSITGAGVLIGTPEYMSPEQVDGKDVNQRSDIYSLGVILYEMTTGRLPFTGETPISVAHKHRYEAPEDPKEVNSQVSDDLARIVLRCLAKDPDQRYRSAAELGAELERIEEGLPTTARLAAERKVITSKEITVTFSAKKLMILSLVLLALIAAGIILWRTILSNKATQLSPSAQPALAILYFENISRDPTLDDWKTGIPRLLTTDLAQSKFLNVLSDERVYGILRNLNLLESEKYSTNDLLKIVRDAKATHVATGSIMRAGEKIILTLTIQKPGTAEPLIARRFECIGEQDILARADEISAQIKESMGLSKSMISGDLDSDATNITTRSPEAFKLYSKGRKLHLAGEYEKSLEVMKNAVEIDPEFALAYRSIAQAETSMGLREESRKHLQQAMELSRRASARERFWIQVDYYGMSEVNYDNALKAAMNWVDVYPEDTRAIGILGRQYMYIEDFDQAIKYLNLSVQKGESSPFFYYHLAAVYTASGLYEKADEVNKLGQSLFPENSLIKTALINNLVGRGLIDQALAETEKSLGSGLSADLRRGDFLRLKDKFNEAASIYGRNDPSNPYIEFRLPLVALAQGRLKQAEEMAKGNHLLLADLCRKKGDFSGALAECEIAWSNAEKDGNLTSQILALQTKGLVELAQCHPDVAWKTAADLKRLAETGINKKQIRHYYYLAGMIEIEANRYTEAIRDFNKAISLLPFQSWELGHNYHALFLDGLATAYCKSGNLTRAEKEYEKIAALSTGRLGYGDIYAKSFHMRGKIAEWQGDKTRARANYQRFLDLWKDADPGLPEVTDAKARLTQLKGN